MKNIFKLFTVILILYVNIISAQSPWELPGNSIAGGDFLGTTNTQPLELKTTNTTTSQPINFYTNNTQRATIGSGGNLGIGTTTPNYMLHQDGGTGNTTYHQFTNGTTSGTGINDGFLIGISTASEGRLNMQAAKPIQFIINGSQRVEFTSGGRVGIGTSTAQSSIHQHIGSNSSIYHQFTNSRTGQTDATYGFRIGLTDNGTVAEAELRLKDNAAMRFHTNATERMVITGAGDVGIGTASPQSQLHISNTSTNPYLQITNSASGTGSGDGFKIGVVTSVYPEVILNQQENAYMRFYTNNTERMSLSSSGHLGIGVTTPLNALDVMNTLTTNDYAASFTNSASYSGGSVYGAILATNNIVRTSSSNAVNDGIVVSVNGSDYVNRGLVVLANDFSTI